MNYVVASLYWINHSVMDLLVPIQESYCIHFTKSFQSKHVISFLSEKWEEHELDDFCCCTWQEL